MNDLVRDKLRHENGVLPLYAEIIAGGTVSRFRLTHANLFVCFVPPI